MNWQGGWNPNQSFQSNKGNHANKIVISNECQSYVCWVVYAMVHAIGLTF